MVNIGVGIYNLCRKLILKVYSSLLNFIKLAIFRLATARYYQAMKTVFYKRYVMLQMLTKVVRDNSNLKQKKDFITKLDVHELDEWNK